MFNFFKNRKDAQQASKAKMQSLKEVIEHVGSSRGSLLEAALVLHLTEENQESLARLLMTFGASDPWILNQGGERLGDPAVTEGSDGAPYVAAFTSLDRATAAVAEWGLPNHPSPISALELVFALNAGIGIVLNANEQHFQWNFTPLQVSNLRTLYEGSHQYEVGGIYSVWKQGAYGAVKLLHLDEGGLHIRLYGNAWPGRPAEIDVAALTLDSGGDLAIQAVGHMPVVKSSFLAMGPRKLSSAPVTEDELEGYRMWADAKGGYFGV